jgi:hypothetical protein
MSTIYFLNPDGPMSAESPQIPRLSRRGAIVTQGHAGDPAQRRGKGDVDASALGRGRSAEALPLMLGKWPVEGY